MWASSKSFQVVANPPGDTELREMAEKIFNVFGLTLWEMRHSDNYENGRYYLAYAMNARLSMYDCDWGDGYPFMLTIDRPEAERPAGGRIPDSAHMVLETLAILGLHVREVV